MDGKLRIADVARAILHERRYLTTMRLQKLVYYSQAYSLATYEKELFQEQFQAWPCGMVSPELYELHRGEFMIEDGDLGAVGHGLASLSGSDKVSISTTLERLGKMTGSELSALSTGEGIWKAKHGGVGRLERGTDYTTSNEIMEYYSQEHVCSAHPLFVMEH